MTRSYRDPSLVDEDPCWSPHGQSPASTPYRAIFQTQCFPDIRLAQGDMPSTRALTGQTPPAAWNTVREVEIANGVEPGSDALAQPGIRFTARMEPPAAGAGSTAGIIQLQSNQPLALYRSQPLLSLVKSLNDFSNNIIKPFADAAGGPTAVESLARSAVPEEMRSEITLGDGAGTDPTNRLSPRAAVKLLRALEEELFKSGHALYDILPVAGVDTGTLHDRLNAPEETGWVVGKPEPSAITAPAP